MRVRGAQPLGEQLRQADVKTGGEAQIHAQLGLQSGARKHEHHRRLDRPHRFGRRAALEERHLSDNLPRTDQRDTAAPRVLDEDAEQPFENDIERRDVTAFRDENGVRVEPLLGSRPENPLDVVLAEVR